MEAQNLTSPEEWVRSLSYPLYKNKGWIKFLGIMSILYGIVAAVTMVGIIFAWLPIWLGVLINGAANQVEKAYIVGDRNAFIAAQKKISTYFLIYAVVVLIGVVFFAVFLVVLFSTGLYSHMWHQMQSQGIY